MTRRSVLDPILRLQHLLTSNRSIPAYLRWTPILAGAIVAAALSFVLLSFASAIGLAVASPSSTWRDTSWTLALLGGLWLLLTSLASFGIGGYLAGRLREFLGKLKSHMRSSFATASTVCLCGDSRSSLERFWRSL